jgi:hypothetical protein
VRGGRRERRREAFQKRMLGDYPAEEKEEE